MREGARPQEASPPPFRPLSAPPGDKRNQPAACHLEYLRMGLGDVDTRSLFPKAPPHFSPDGVNRLGRSEGEP